MTHFTLDELRSIITSSAGDLEIADGALDGDILDTTLLDLGLDSLALMDVTTSIRRLHGVRVDLEQLTEQSSVRDLVDHVDRLIAARSAEEVSA